MTKILRQRLFSIVIVLALNILVSVCGAIAFTIYIFRDDPIMAAVPALIAAMGIIFQPWSLLFLLLPPVTWALSPFLTTAITIFVYNWLDRQGKLNRVKRVLRQLKIPQILWAGGIAIATGISIMYARSRDFPAFNHKPPSIVQETLTQAQIPVRDSYSYTISHFLDSEYIWQASLTPQDFLRLKANLGVQPIKLPQNQLPQDFIEQSPYWWHPVLSPKTQVYATSEFPFADRGQDGVHVFLIWNPDRKIVHLWLKSNF
ncbi:hypothetical protein [Merismopedia glauca]|uniref:Uncharacterized protein n=1 Tax=Merismopedia glauca CCAP 1448/3 TaxID=1296344 RepID=A0A2T1C605_9CYAN|nr:hypothetical protein [Merismopedia glauca]PSB03563.1 hypothetical protein C7B64_07890 [Merismopedia glauca CCAP 1448/3]